MVGLPTFEISSDPGGLPRKAGDAEKSGARRDFSKGKSKARPDQPDSASAARESVEGRRRPKTVAQAGI
jgi:hypothetical protein